MARKIHIGIAALAAALAASGCASTGDMERALTAKNDEIAALQKQQDSLEQENSALKQQQASLAQDNAALKQQLESSQEQSTAMQQKNAAMQQQLGSLEQRNVESLASAQERQQQYEALAQALSKEVAQGQLQVRQYDTTLTVELAEQTFFDAGRAALKPGGKNVLQKVGEALKKHDNKIIRVVGHTDNVPVAKPLRGQFPTSWELSVARATNVVRFLQQAGIAPGRMVASGRGEYDPVASNDTPDGRKKNRRIEIMLIDKGATGEATRQDK